MAEFITGFKEASGVISLAIEGVANKMRELSERLLEIVGAKLDKIPKLFSADLDITHEWLSNSADSSTAFILRINSHGFSVVWIGCTRRPVFDRALEEGARCCCCCVCWLLLLLVMST
eukprot:TRINITY_DN1511_c3_g2_i1.p1 TRINITY_DN1511_c3_g2~~TRINITY_DN1511_c3_g2_i1.p1  ORF type:complete len:118 (+),score=8.46 TRINITY_DN1511_c3_g2_i1:339-692(+)